MALDEREEVREHLEDVDEGSDANLDDRRMQVRLPRARSRCCCGTRAQLCATGVNTDTGAPATQQYANLFFLLQSEPRHIASLCRLVSLSEIDTLLQTVMFTLYGNQYESREEHLLLTMFQVCRPPLTHTQSPHLAPGRAPLSSARLAHSRSSRRSLRPRPSLDRSCAPTRPSRA